MGISSAEAARRLGIHANTVTKYKTRGAPYSIALACAALYHRLNPWS
jgi:transposase